MMNSQERFTQICTFLDQQDWKYHPDPDQQRLGLMVEDEMVIIGVEEDGEFIKFILPQLLTVPADHPHYEAALETLAHFGWEYKLVRWQRDPDDGEVRVQADLPIEDSELTAAQFWRTLQGTVQKVYNRAADICRRLGLDKDLLRILRYLGVAYQTQSELGESPSQNLQRAIYFYTEVAEIANRLGLDKDLSSTLTNLGVAYWKKAELGEHPSENLNKAIAAYNKAAKISRDLGLEKDLYSTLTNLGNAYLTQAELEEQPSANLIKAITAYDEAAKILLKLGLEKDLYSTLTNLGNAYRNQAKLGEMPSENLVKAIEAYYEAAKILRKLGLEKDLSSNLKNLGVAYSDQAKLGENPYHNLQKAIAAYDEAVDICRKLGLDRDLSITLTHLGNAYLSQAELFRRPQLKKKLFSNLNNLGIAYSTQAELGEMIFQNQQQAIDTDNNGKIIFQKLQQAIDTYNNAVEILVRLGLWKELSITLNHLGEAYLTQAQCKYNPFQNLELAIDAYNHAAEILRRGEFDKELTTTLTGLGSAYLTQAKLGEIPYQNLQQAIYFYCEAAAIRRKLGLEKDLSSTLTNLGIAYRTQAELGERPSENRQKAANCYREALKFFRPQLLPVECLKAARALGNLGFQQGDWQMALEGYQTAMAAIDYSRTQRVSSKEREEVVAKSIYIYENAIQAAINLKDIPTALEIVERVRAKRLVDLLATADLYQNGDIPDTVRQYLQKLDDLDNEIAQKRDELGDDSRETKPDGTKTRQLRAATEVSADIAQLEQQKQGILDELSNLDQVVAKLRQVQPPKLADFIPLLQDSPRTALVSFYSTDNDTQIFILRHGETKPDCFTCQGQGYETLQLWLRETWVKPYVSNKTQWIAQMPATLAALAQRLEIDRLIEEKLQGLDELILIPHLFLHQIPFAALPLSGEIPPSPPSEGGNRTEVPIKQKIDLSGLPRTNKNISSGSPLSKGGGGG